MSQEQSKLINGTLTLNTRTHALTHTHKRTLTDVILKQWQSLPTSTSSPLRVEPEVGVGTHTYKLSIGESEAAEPKFKASLKTK